MNDEVKAGGGRPGKGLLVVLVAIVAAIVLLYINVVTSGGASSQSSQIIEGGARPPTAVTNGSITPASTPAFVVGLEALGVSGESRRSSRGRTLVSADEDSDLLDDTPFETNQGIENNALVTEESDSLFSGQTLNAVSLLDQAREEIRQREDTRLYEARLASFSAALNSATTVFQAAETPENEYPELTRGEIGTVRGNTSRKTYELAPGTVIGGLLATDINTQIQGAVIAQVLEDVYDSGGEGVLLVPMGSRLVGSTEQVNVGAERVEIAMTSLVYPSGGTVPLDPPWPVSDSAGRAGLAGRVDRNYWQNFGNAILLGGVGAGLQLSQPRPGPTGGISSREIAAGEVGQQVGRLGSEYARQGLDMSPTITIDRGHKITIMLSATAFLPPAK